MRNKVTQSLVVGGRQLTEQVSDLENNSVKVDARTLFFSCLLFISLLNYDPLTLFGQADDVIVVSVQDQWLR